MKFFKAVTATLDMSDVAIIAGCLVALAGVWMVYAPLSVMLAGAMLVSFGGVTALAKNRAVAEAADAEASKKAQEVNR